MTHVPLRDSVAEIDLDAISHNTATLGDRAGAPVIAVVKADGYGHGAEPSALACLDGGAAMLAVATVEEALVLRRARIDAPVLVMLGVTTSEEAVAAAAHDLQVAVWREDQLDWLDEAARGEHRSVAVHLKIETGLVRLGAPPAEVPAMERAVRRRRGLRLAGIYTHLATAEGPDLSFARRQLDQFRAALHALDSPPEWQHALATGGILAIGREGSFTGVRPGIGLYGLPPAPHLADVVPLRRALTLRSRLARVMAIPSGTGVSYGLEWIADGERVIGTVPFGYADGLPRRASPGAHFLVRGKSVPIVGRVCMDLCMVDLTDATGAREGDPVIIIGPDDGAGRTADDLAAELGTINYEVVANLHARVPRVYRRGARVVGVKTAAAGFTPA
jgi:alanine racemase